MSERHAEIRLDNLFTAQTILVILKFIGVPYFAEASWWTIFIPTFFSLGSIVLFFIILTLINRR